MDASHYADRIDESLLLKEAHATFKKFTKFYFIYSSVRSIIVMFLN